MALLAKKGRLSRAIPIDRRHLTPEVFSTTGMESEGVPVRVRWARVKCQPQPRTRLHTLFGDVVRLLIILTNFDTRASDLHLRIWDARRSLHNFGV